MNPRKLMAAGLVAVASAAFAAEVNVGEVNVGNEIAPFSLDDQFDQHHAVDGQTRVLLFSRDKDMAKMAFGVLDRREPSYLEDRRAFFVLDISKMPGIITWAIGKPRMRRHKFPLLLDAGPTVTKAFPSQEKRLTLIYLDGLAVRSVSYVSDAAELEKALDALPR